jgi:organic radical activating enzyme
MLDGRGTHAPGPQTSSPLLQERRFEDPGGNQLRPLPASWFTVSPKPGRFDHHPGYTRRAKEVKLIVTRTLTFAAVSRLRREFPAAIPLLLQPESNAPWSVAKSLRLVTRALRVGLKNVRVSVQLHKIYKLR